VRISTQRVTGGLKASRRGTGLKPVPSPLEKRCHTSGKNLYVLTAILAFAFLPCALQATEKTPSDSPAASSFAEQVDLSPFHRVAVQADGRLRSYESHAKTFMGYVSGPRKIDGQSYGFTYLDLIFRPEAYRDKDIVFVKNKQVRAQIVEALKNHAQLDAGRRAAIVKTGLIARTLLAEPPVVALLQRLGGDLIRTAKVVDAIQSALTVCNAAILEENLRMVAPPDGDVKTPWLSIAQLARGGGAPQDSVHAGMATPAPIPGLPADVQTGVREAWPALRAAWRAQDAPKVNEQIARLAAIFPTVSPELYPSEKRLRLESWYFRNRSMTWVWWFYAAALAPLLMSIVYKWRGARRVGLGLFALGFLGHTASLIVRWYISGRWPNSNMFEAVHTSAWLGGGAAILLEFFTRRTPVRNVFALASAAASMTALMVAYFLPAHLDSTINNKMAALNDVWLYIHTNMIILSYALITFCCVAALLTLCHRWFVALRERTMPAIRLFLIPVAAVVANVAGYLLLMHVIDHAHRGLRPETYWGAAGAFVGSMTVLVLELLSRTRAPMALSAPRSASGGAASLILGMGGRRPFVKEEGPTFGQVLDGATMVLLELSFITLWTGIVMGAIWADHSWGRPWGWDPKEVFALNTFIIFLILVHVRLKVRDKGFWTAVLAVIGFEVMMFNWIVVNFIISGLHSYA